MSTPKLYVYGLPENARYSLLRSPRWTDLQALLRDGGHPAMWSRRLRGWTVRTERVGDVIALAEVTGWDVTMKGALGETKKVGLRTSRSDAHRDDRRDATIVSGGAS